MSNQARTVVDFTVAYIVISIILTVVLIALDAMFGLNPGSAAAVASLFGAAYWAGDRHVARTNTLPTSRECWMLALYFSAVVSVMSLAIFFALLAIGDMETSNVVSVLGGSALTIVLIAALIICFLMLRFVFSFSARMAMKNRSKDG